MSNNELTLAIIKPDALKNGLAPIIEQAFVGAGLEIVTSKFLCLSAEQACTITGMLREEHLMPLIVDYLTSGEVKILILHGEDAIEKAREVIGQTRLSNREGSGLRGLYATDYLHNAIHGSSTKAEAERDMATLTPEFFSANRETRY